ncbi:hypothetical protein AB0D46_14020 [Streptomyces sp. NPDC048383]|uniref:hypothetical protein n=1 Tax=Streptomyces sp. NPDC048383 TaxID=3155386 RepID=UPI003425184E
MTLAVGADGTRIEVAAPPAVDTVSIEAPCEVLLAAEIIRPRTCLVMDLWRHENQAARRTGTGSCQLCAARASRWRLATPVSSAKGEPLVPPSNVKAALKLARKCTG